MSIIDQCNYLKKLYESKYCQESYMRNKMKVAQSLKKILSNFKQEHKRCFSFDEKSKLNQEFNEKKQKKIYPIEYCNQDLLIKPPNYKEFSVRKYKRKAQSEITRREQQLRKTFNKIGENSIPILHTKQSMYANFINKRKSKFNLQNSILQSKNNQNLLQMPKQRIQQCKTQIGFDRHILPQQRRTFYGQQIKNKHRKPTSKGKDQELMPWSIEYDEFS